MVSGVAHYVKTPFLKSSGATQLIVKKNLPDQSGLVTYRTRIVGEKRSAILDAAITKFLELGYDRTSLEAIATAAAVSTGTLFKHFPTKASLFGAIMARAWENDAGSAPVSPPPGDPKAALTAIGQDYARLLSGPGVAALFRLVIAEAPRFPEIGRELYERGKAPYLTRIHQYLVGEVKAGTLLVADEQLSRCAREFLGMINDQVFWPRFLVVDLLISEEEVAAVVASAVETFLARYQVHNSLH